MKQLPCICGHDRSRHKEMNKKAWDRLNKQLQGYKENTMKDREEFWNTYLTNGEDNEWACSQCDCESFKQDNLKYLEDLYKGKKK